MVEMRLVYEGGLHTQAVHGPSTATLETDAPVDNQGKGEAFSPTDLLATSLASCMLTTMAIVGEREVRRLHRFDRDRQLALQKEPPVLR